MPDISKLNSQYFLKLELGDVKNKKNLSQDEDQKKDAKVREVADLYEKYFLKEMMKQMRSTVTEGGFMKANNAEKIFTEQLDDQYSSEWNKRGGFGISDMIYKDLTEKFGQKLGLKKEIESPHGPLPLDKKIQVKPLNSINPKNMTLLLQSEALKTTDSNLDQDRHIEIQSPWAGVLQKKTLMDNGQTAFEIKHDNGLDSLILTHGAPSQQTRHLAAGDKIESGQALGLAPVDSPLVWTVKNSVSE